MESEDEDDSDSDDSDSDAAHQVPLSSKTGALSERDSLNPFANEAEASKSLRNYTRQSTLNTDKDLVLTSSGLNIVKTLLPRTLQLMCLCRGNYAFDLFLQLTHVAQVYLYTVLCMFNTCHACSYDEDSIE